MSDDSRFRVMVEYSSRGVDVRVQRLTGTAYAQTISKPSWLERKIGITFEGQVRGAIKRTQRICDKLNKQLDEAQEVCKAVEKQS